MNRIILIGGSPTAGKSYTAEKIAESLEMDWISTDAIRTNMRKSLKKEAYPDLFEFAEATPQMAVEFLTQNTAQEIVASQNRESKDVWEGVKAVIEAQPPRPVIIEGVAILPHLVAQLKDKRIKSVFLVDEDVDRIRKTIFTRGLWDDADKYSDDVKEKEVEWVLAFNDYIIKEARKYGFPVVKIGDRKEYISKIKKLVA